MNKTIRVTFLLAIMLLVACSEQEKVELTRIDVIPFNEEMKMAYHIHLKEVLTSVENSFGQVKWEPNVEPEMAREPDVKTIFFYTYDKNMPERLVNYQIWFNQDHTATIITDNKHEGYGTLDKEHAEILKYLFVKVRGAD